MSVFPTNIAIPSKVSSKQKNKVLYNNFGDGYDQVASDGINNKEVIFTLTWDKMSENDMFSLSIFVDSTQGYSAFSWVNPADGETYQVRILENSEFSKDKDQDLYTNVSLQLKMLYGS